MWAKERADEAIAEGKLRPNPRTGRPEYLIAESEESLLTSLARMRVPKMVKNSFKSAFCFWVTFQSMNCEWA